MKILRALFFLMAVVFCCAPVWGQNIEGQIIASQYGRWKVPGYAANTYSFAPDSCRVQGGASFFFAFSVGTPISIVDANPALTETVSPTSSVNSNVTCSISISPANTHQLPFYIASASGGLQEAINQNLTTPQNNTILLDNGFYQLVGGPGNAATVIATVQGSSKLGLVDVTQVPTVWYQWNGSQYAKVGNGGVGTGLNTLVNDLVANSSSNAGAQDLDNFVTGPGFSAQAAVNAATANNGVATLTPSSGVTPFTNNSSATGVKVDDLDHLGASYRSVTEFGAQCDLRHTGVSFSQGSTAVSIYYDLFYAYDVGKTLVTVGTVGGVPTAFETTIVSITNEGAGAVMASAAPFTLTGSNLATLGHDDTAAIAQAMASAATNQQSGGGYFQAVLFPGGNCLTHTAVYNGVSMTGLNGAVSNVSGFPGEDVFAEPDPASGTYAEGNNAHIHDFTINVDNRIDATLPWQLINDSGATAKAALYRPIGIKTAPADNPLGPGWFQGGGANHTGAYNGVAAVTAGSAVICTPTALTQPVVGNTLVFPYLASVFTTTVASTAGSCGSGTARTLTAAMPTGSTNSQAEWFSGTSVQTLSVAVSGGACPATITLTNSIQPSPATETNVGSFGLVQIDGEQFTYFGKTNAALLGSNFLTITGCAQNGTTRAAHSIGATVVPLNQYRPSYPWPVTPTVNAGTTTPTGNTAFYPAWNVGNAAFAAPNSNGNLGIIGAGSFANSLLNELYIDSYPLGVPSNHTAGLYLVGLPYSTGFESVTVSATYFGIVEGTPSFNTGGSWAGSQPTADGTHWQGIRISSCVVSDLISGGQNSFKDWNVYSQCYSGGNYVGANACLYFTQAWNDEGGYGQAIQGNVDLHNMYCEPEGGSQYGAMPVFEFDLSKANWDNLHLGGGGETFIGGNNQHFQGGNFNNQAIFPVLNYGYGNGADGTQFLTFGSGVGNVYGVNSLINYGPNSSFSGATSQNNALTSPYGANQLGNSREPWHGQSNETFNTGNTTTPYVNSNAGYIPAWEFNNWATANPYQWEANPFAVGWAYDATSPSGGSVGCQVNTVGDQACFVYQFDQEGILIGAGQRLVPGKYMMHVSSRSTGAATSYSLKLGGCSLGDVGSYTVPVSANWPAPDYAVMVDFTGKGTCGSGLSLDFIYASPVTDTIYVAYVDFAPVPEVLTAQTINATTINLPSGSSTGGTATGCSQSPVTGINGGYTCPVRGWSGVLAANQGASDPTATLGSSSGVAAAGCFFVDAEYECYTGLSGSTLTGITRGSYATTAGTHTSGAGVSSIDLVLGSVQQLPGAEEVTLGGSPTTLAVNNPFPVSHANQNVMSVNAGGNETWFDPIGSIHQVNPYTTNTFGATTIGGLPSQPNIQASGYLLQTNGQNTAYQPLALGGGHAGSLNVIATPTIGAPTGFSTVAAGASSVTYVCAGTDFDGNLIPGTTFTLTGLVTSWSFPASNFVQCPWAAGVNTYQIYRTVGGVNQGLILSAAGPGAYIYDFDGSATSGTPPSVNGSNPHLSVAGSGTPSLQLGTTNISSGTGAPVSACGTAPIGSGSLWLRTDGSNSLYSCVGSSWIAVVIP